MTRPLIVRDNGIGGSAVVADNSRTGPKTVSGNTVRLSPVCRADTSSFEGTGNSGAPHGPVQPVGPSGMDAADGIGCNTVENLEATTNASVLTAVVEIRGTEGAVLEQGTRLLRLVADELGGARLLSLRLVYDPGSRPEHLVDSSACDLLEVAGRGPTSPQEAKLWHLALRAANTRPAMPGPPGLRRES